ncbi:MAG: valine--tRNA ligase [Candidatus Magasanikbacteria bacterium]|nr:valine--tRNA ligase [Candidatus Magasanikbacteria bacterium]
MMEKAYDPKKYEADIYRRWEASGFFAPEARPPWADNPGPDTREPYTIIMPPPNANAPSHVGHALGYTIQDILIRWQRMRGRRTLWLPGTDHAGFETQVVFEKKLEKEGLSRFKMTREEFYQACWDYVQTNKHISEEAIRRLGASCDWSRNIFTLDPEIIKVVYQTFKQMYDDGLIYRGNRISHWCPKHQTTLSDLETKYEERAEPFYYFKYGPFVIGTSRPETKFGDKYVVMHPDDPRYAKYHEGQQINLEWINGPITATIIKDQAVDREFGTGVMTITPAHDAVDFAIAERRGLDIEPVIDKRGKLLPIAGEFAGRKILEARSKIVEKLQAKGLVDHIDKKYQHNVQMCYKCSTLIEPQIVPQWYVAMTKPLPGGRPSLRDLALQALDKKEVEIVTERFAKIFRHWMENIRDWPISRQIWWGIPIPVKYCGDCGEIIIDVIGSVKKCPQCSREQLTPDPDTFDTWFSSGQWPYATLLANDAKQGTQTLAQYYPTQVMETAWDILFFWVARMIMFSYYRTGKPPFQKVFLHGLVRDKDRQKMSKSKGNVIDPLGVIDLYGADALRFALIFSTAAGNDIPLAEDKIKGMKHFANKVWNIARYITGIGDGHVIPAPVSFPRKRESTGVNSSGNPVPASDWIPAFGGDDKWTDADKLILSQLNQTITDVTDNLENFRLHEAAQTLYDFIWHEFADKYLEASKEQLKNEALKNSTLNNLYFVLATSLKLLHPFMPFVTEAIWGEMYGKERLLIVEKWSSSTDESEVV